MGELLMGVALGCMFTLSPYVSWLHWKNREWAASVFTMVVVDVVLTIAAIELL